MAAGDTRAFLVELRDWLREELGRVEERLGWVEGRLAQMDRERVESPPLPHGTKLAIVEVVRRAGHALDVGDIQAALRADGRRGRVLSFVPVMCERLVHRGQLVRREDLGCGSARYGLPARPSDP